MISELIEEAVAILQCCHEVWHEQDRASGRHQPVRADAEVAAAGSQVSGEHAGMVTRPCSLSAQGLLVYPASSGCFVLSSQCSCLVLQCSLSSSSLAYFKNVSAQFIQPQGILSAQKISHVANTDYCRLAVACLMSI